MKALTIVANDRIGLLLDVTSALAKHNVNIESISVEVIGRKAVIHLVTDKPGTQGILKKAGYKVMADDTIVVRLADRPGELSKVAKILADAGIGIENVQVIDKHSDSEGRRFIANAVRVDKPELARKLLKPFMND